MYVIDGDVATFEPTLAEIEHLSQLFEEIVWLGFKKKGHPSANYRKSHTDRIRFILLPNAVGGQRLRQKLLIPFFIPKLIYQIVTRIAGVQYIHSRGPSLPAAITIIISMLDSKRKYWHKYAGNWVQKNPPASYAIQRFLLRKIARHIITVNGKWPGERTNVLSFENPCLTVENRVYGRKVLDLKQGNTSRSFCFAGRLESQKGVDVILDTFSMTKSKIDSVHLIGDGTERSKFEMKARSIPIECNFYGFLYREEVFKIFEICNFFIFPSRASEGFPKAIAEAANFGCIPIVSDVSSIGQYVNNENGFVWNMNEEPFEVFFNRINWHDQEALRKKRENAYRMSELFTYPHYLSRVKNEVFGI